MSLRAIPAPLWFVAALVPMVVSQIVRLEQSDPATWIFWDYAGRVGALAVLAAIPSGRIVAFQWERLSERRILKPPAGLSASSYLTWSRRDAVQELCRGQPERFRRERVLRSAGRSRGGREASQIVARPVRESVN